MALSSGDQAHILPLAEYRPSTPVVTATEPIHAVNPDHSSSSSQRFSIRIPWFLRNCSRIRRFYGEARTVSNHAICVLERPGGGGYHCSRDTTKGLLLSSSTLPKELFATRTLRN